ncbi:S-layer homology domain-containing protein [Zhenhengia yiwuensis]|uniref:S-layer homology domain-containing protein n=1 Tax=Zhenhengia yiwuensis TaxID=2763666 RepID=UPI002A765325|nr:ZmpA/ZmpB/ZmpC family metallo-endopeptidase [Zhenhengia yiwuensis]MDY3366892.1 ZmpA/ZmpB/ZmpC family metallo-endopeptidase [Zhenhengia yiwuensis]
MSILKKKLCLLTAIAVLTTNMPIMARSNFTAKPTSISQRIIMYKDILGAEVYKRVDNAVVLQTELPTGGTNVKDYLVRVDMYTMPDFYATVKEFVTRDGKLYLKLNDPNTPNSVINVEYGNIEGNIAKAKGKISITGNGYLDELSKVDGYQLTNKIAYENVYKLMPFYEGKDIIQYGNIIPEQHKLHTTKVMAFLPMDADGELVTYLTKENPDRVKSVLAVFEDKTTATYSVSYESTKDNISNYIVSDLNILYTFDRFLISEKSSAVSQLEQHIKSTDYDNYLAKLSGNTKDIRSLRDYYKVIQSDAKGVALEILSNVDELIPTVESDVYDAMLTQSMETGEGATDSLMFKLLYTYNYYERFYGFDINNLDVSDVLLFKGDELFDSNLTLKTLSDSMVKTTAKLRAGANTHGLYKSELEKLTKKANVGEFVDYLVELFTDFTDPSDWFIDTYSKKGFVKEIKSDKFIYRAYDQLKKRQQYLLPLLTLEDWSFYLISMPGQLMVGSPKAYVKDPLNKEDSQELWRLIDDFSEKAFLYMDTIGRFINDDRRINDLMILCMDKRNITNAEGEWEHQYLEGEVDGDTKPLSQDPFHKDFTEVVGVWIKNNGTAAVGGGETVRWVAYTALKSFNEWSHEVGHNIDIPLMMKGGSLRGDMEDYTTGIIHQGNDDGPYHFNVSVRHDITDTISNNFTPERINSPEKVHSYYKGMFETLDLLDYLEAKAFLKLTKEEQDNVAYYAFYTKNHMSQDDIGYHTYGLYPLNKRFQFPHAPNATDNPKTLSELYDTRIVLRPGTKPKPGDTGEELTITPYVADNIYTRWWYTPHYSQGRGDSRTFKVMGFRMLAEAGYDNGFVKYLSFGSNTDLDGIRNITKKNSFKDWRMDKFAEIESKLNQLAYIDAEELEAEFLEALKLDASNSDREVTYSTKVRQRNYYLLKRMTEDFMQSIYDQEQKVVPISTIEDLQMLIDVPNGNYELVNDINVSSATGKAVIDGIFVGKLNGNGHKIYGSQLPLFTEVRHAFIENLSIENAGNGIAIKNTNSKLKEVQVPIQYIPVSTMEQFLSIKNNLNGNYKLTANIDFSEYKPTANASVINNKFTGVIDGNGFTIQNLNGASLFNNFEGTASNLHIKDFTNKASNSEYVSAFAKQTNNAKLSDITFDNIEIVGRQYTGVVVGADRSKSQFERISIKNANVVAKGGFYNSMFIGRKYGGRISDVYLDGTLEVSTTENGGLVGTAHDGVQMNRIVSRINLNMPTNTDGQKRKQNGGIIGNIYSPSTLKNSVYLGKVTGDTYSLTGSTAKSQFYKVYEYNGSGGITSADGNFIQSIGFSGLTEQLYKELGFDESVWSYQTINEGYPILVAPEETCLSPVITPNGGPIKGKQEVTIETQTTGAAIYFTLDGTNPTRDSNLYTSPFEISEPTVVKAVAFKEGMNPSAIVEAQFVELVKLPTPVAEIDFINERLVNVTTGSSYIINGETYTADNGYISIKPTWMNGQNISIVQLGNDSFSNSDEQLVNIPPRPTVPKLQAVNESYPNANNGKVLGVDSTMEYRTSKRGDWTPITSNELTGLTSGDYFIRCKAVQGSSFASEETVVTVGVDDVVLTGLTVTKAPNKLNYFVGEIFDSTGMQVVANYSDKTSKPTEAYTVLPNRALTTSDNKVTISLKHNGITVTATQQITVKSIDIVGYYSDEFETELNNSVEVEFNTTTSSALSLLTDKVYIKLNNGDTITGSVTWEFEEHYEPEQPATYKVVGTISGIPTELNPKKLSGIITVLGQPLEKPESEPKPPVPELPPVQMPDENLDSGMGWNPDNYPDENLDSGMGWNPDNFPNENLDSDMGWNPDNYPSEDFDEDMEVNPDNYPDQGFDSGMEWNPENYPDKDFDADMGVNPENYPDENLDSEMEVNPETDQILPDPELPPTEGDKDDIIPGLPLEPPVQNPPTEGEQGGNGEQNPQPDNSTPLVPIQPSKPSNKPLTPIKPSTPVEQQNDTVVQDDIEDNKISINTDEVTGDVTYTVIHDDGTVVSTVTSTNGTKYEITTTAKGNTEVKVEVPKNVGSTILNIKHSLPVNVVPIDIKTGKPLVLSMVSEDGLKVKVNNSVEFKLVEVNKYYKDTTSHWAKDAVSFVTSRELFNGTSKDTFSPNEPMTRAMMLTVLSRFDGNNEEDTKVWYEVGMNWAIERGISDGTNLNENITREQLATLLYRYVGSPRQTSTLDNFSDASQLSQYSKDVMAWAVQNGIISGMEDGSLQPQQIATRAQVAAIMIRLTETLLK